MTILVVLSFCSHSGISWDVISVVVVVVVAVSDVFCCCWCWLWCCRCLLSLLLLMNQIICQINRIKRTKEISIFLLIQVHIVYAGHQYFVSSTLSYPIWYTIGRNKTLGTKIGVTRQHPCPCGQETEPLQLDDTRDNPYYFTVFVVVNFILD